VTLRIGQKEVRTDPGRKRHHNEDSYVFQPPLFAIADGMGGARAGEVASALAADALNEAGRDDGGKRIVVQLIHEANRRVHERASTDAETSGMGTTITVARVEDDGSVTFGHVGDSRGYLLRGNDLEQLTDDHSLVAELVRRGELSAEAAEVHPQRSVITRALGTDPDVDVDAFSVDGEAGDVFLICSDGLSDMVDGTTIEAILREHRANLAEAARSLVLAANRAGGDDNITAILFELVEGADTAGEPDERTREYATSPDEEDTLHPEDAVAPPPAAETSVEPAVRQSEETSAPQAGLGRRLLALAVIVALCVVIVVLVWWGLAR
jgi:serine/threonine protein phosphatase PrpC